MSTFEKIYIGATILHQEKPYIVIEINKSRAKISEIHLSSNSTLHVSDKIESISPNSYCELFYTDTELIAYLSC
jgi:hypothetical protein